MDMTATPPPDVDRRVRDAFPDDGPAAGRLARAALADEATSRRRYGWTALAAAGIVTLAIALTSWPARQTSTPGTDPAPVQDAPLVLSGSMVDGALVVSFPDGSTSIAWGGARNDRPPDGSGIVFVEGVIR
jgi:hypothetical protein